MIPRKSLLIKAADLFAKEKTERDPVLTADLENIAQAYLRFPDQAKRNDETDIIHELSPTKKNGDQL